MYCVIMFNHHLYSVQPSVADGFHIALQDFICRQANFIVRTVGFTLSILRLCSFTFATTKVYSIYSSLLPTKYALDHEGWVVGVVVLWGYPLNIDVENGIILQSM